MSEYIQRGVDRVLAEVLRERDLPESLDGMIRYHLGWVDDHFRAVSPSQRIHFGGKKMRAVLCALACAAAGGTVEMAFPVAAAIELVQNFSLVHDDIEDGDRERRHRPAMWVTWGMPQAINTGSAMQALVNAAVLRVQAPPDTVVAVMEALTWAMVEMTEGQHLDIAFQSRSDVGVDEYEDMASRKTGALMEAAVFTGARLATDEPEPLSAWRELGRAFGLAFQARDDLLGVTGDPARTGKPVGNDIRVRKKALPLLFALEHANDSDRSLVRGILERHTVGEDSVRRVTDVMRRSGALAATAETVERHTANALSALNRAASPGPHRDAVRDLVRAAVGREQ